MLAGEAYLNKLDDTLGREILYNTLAKFLEVRDERPRYCDYINIEEFIKEKIVPKIEYEMSKEKPVVLTEEQTKDREWKKKYEAIKAECREVIIKEKLKVPKEKIKDVLDLLKKQHFTIYEVRALMYPICIDYRLEIDSLWRWMQVKRGAWKA